MSERNPGGRYDRTKQLLTRTAVAGAILWPSAAAAGETPVPTQFQEPVAEAPSAVSAASNYQTQALQAGGDPVGHLDFVTRFPSGIDGVAAIRIAGWTGDTDAPQGPGEVHFYEGANFAGSAIASGSRPDVAAAVPGLAGQSGFDVAITSTNQGDQNFCAFGIGAGAGAPYAGIGCEPEHTGDAPFGDLTVIQNGRQATIFGGEIDPSSAAVPPQVDLSWDGAFVGRMAADRNDAMAAAYPAYGSNRGFAALVTLPDNVRTVCAHGLGVNAAGAPVAGEVTELGCVSVATKAEQEFATLPQSDQVRILAQQYFPEFPGVDAVTQCESHDTMTAQGANNGAYDYFGPLQVDMILHESKFGGLSRFEVKAIMGDPSNARYAEVVRMYFTVARQIFDGNHQAWPMCGRGVFF